MNVKSLLLFSLANMDGSREVSGVLSIINKNRILLISNCKGHYIFPKGGVKKGEKSFEAAKREALEEAGIE